MGRPREYTPQDWARMGKRRKLVASNEAGKAITSAVISAEDEIEAQLGHHLGMARFHLAQHEWVDALYHIVCAQEYDDERRLRGRQLVLWPPPEPGGVGA